MQPPDESSGSGLQIAFLQFRALPRPQTQAVPQVAFEIAITLVDGLEARREERGVDRADGLPDLVWQIGRGGGIAPVESVRQKIILGDDALGHAERVQDQRASEAGAVLARG